MIVFASSWLTASTTLPSCGYTNVCNVAVSSFTFVITNFKKYKNIISRKIILQIPLGFQVLFQKYGCFHPVFRSLPSTNLSLEVSLVLLFIREFHSLLFGVQQRYCRRVTSFLLLYWQYLWTSPWHELQNSLLKDCLRYPRIPPFNLIRLSRHMGRRQRFLRHNCRR